jgi:hypothetical protein
MSRDIYALLVGINDYPANVGKLNGCLNDADHFHGYLTDNFDRSRLHIEVLKDADATRPNIIKQFRSHLSQAKAGDVAVFQYCGHGARWKSAKAFEPFFPDGKDEGLVCYDSRGPGGFDPADKELAALLAELAKNEPHIAVILDCCHSGSATLDFLHALIHPDDAGNVWAAVDLHLVGSTPSEIECRLRTKAGDYRWFLIRGQTTRDEASGKAVRMAGAIQDITDRARPISISL